MMQSRGEDKYRGKGLELHIHKNLETKLEKFSLESKPIQFYDLFIYPYTNSQYDNLFR